MKKAVSPAVKAQNLLLETLRKINIARPDSRIDKLWQYLSLIDKWNGVYNLTAIRDPNEMVLQHLIDSLMILPYLKGNAFIDVGSGAGLPGVPLAIALPHKHFVLLDSNGKKTRFLTQVKIECALENITIAHNKIEDYQPAQKMDGILSRAFAALSLFIAKTRHIATAQTKWYAMKSKKWQEEVSALPPEIILQQAHAIQLPDGDYERVLLELGLDCDKESGICSPKK